MNENHQDRDMIRYKNCLRQKVNHKKVKLCKVDEKVE